MSATKSYGELLAEYERERSDPAWRPVSLGFGSIDAEIRGVSPGQVLLIAARSGVGKTWMLETIEANFSSRTDAGQVSLSLEMPGAEWAERALAIHNDVAPEQVEVWAKQRTLAQNSAEFLHRMRNALVVEDAVRISGLSDVLAEARARLEVPVRLVTVDYMGLIGVPGATAYERASAVALAVKAFAKRESVAVILAAQLSRAGQSGEIPVTKQMLRDSGCAEESGDFILGCHRPGKALSDDARLAMVDEELEEADCVMTVEVLKNRKGRENRCVDLRFRPDSRRLYEPADPFNVGGVR